MKPIAARQRVADLLGGHEPEQVAWERASEDGFWPASKADYSAADIQNVADYFRRTLTIPERFGVPKDWPERSRMVFARFEPDASDVRRLFGLAEALPFADLEAFLQRVAADEPRVGDRDCIEYAVPGDNWRRVLRIWRGITQADEDDALRLPDAEMHAVHARTNRLWRVRNAARHIADVTACDPGEVVVFLFCGKIPLLPWVSVSRCIVSDEQAGEFLRFTLEIGSPEVSPREVAEAYRRALEEAGAFRERLLLAWCKTRKPRGADGWADFLEDWNATYPHWQYSSAESLRVRSRQIAKERESAEGDGNDD